MITLLISMSLFAADALPPVVSGLVCDGPCTAVDYQVDDLGPVSDPFDQMTRDIEPEPFE